MNRATMRGMGVRIRTARKLRGLTQSELAAKLEIDRSSIADWEAGNSMVHASDLPELAAILQVDINFFFQKDENLDTAA
jgi:transcriptional regulator with XRE-family HTH domain